MSLRILVVSISILTLYLGAIICLTPSSSLLGFNLWFHLGESVSKPVSAQTMTDLPPHLKKKKPVKTEPATDKEMNSAPAMSADGTKPETMESELDPLSFDKKWRVIHHVPHPKPGMILLTPQMPVEELVDLEIHGPHPDHPFLMGEYKVDGLWHVNSGVIRRRTGKNLALKVGYGENYDIEGVVSLDGLGGWFLLLGYEDGHGYCISNVNMKTAASGSPFMMYEIRGNTGLVETDLEITRYVCQPNEQFFLTVKDKKVNLKLSKTVICKDFELPNYHAGSIVLGSYDTKYGPKDVRIHSLRGRTN
jgi:hypothetical protein